MILSLIYRDYICEPELKEKLLARDKEEIRIEEEILREKYSVDNIFKNRTNYQIEDNQQESTKIIEYKESFLKRIINKIKHFFRR